MKRKTEEDGARELDDLRSLAITLNGLAVLILKRIERLQGNAKSTD